MRNALGLGDFQRRGVLEEPVAWYRIKWLHAGDFANRGEHQAGGGAQFLGAGHVMAEFGGNPVLEFGDDERVEAQVGAQRGGFLDGFFAGEFP